MCRYVCNHNYVIGHQIFQPSEVVKGITVIVSFSGSVKYEGEWLDQRNVAKQEEGCFFFFFQVYFIFSAFIHVSAKIIYSQTTGSVGVLSLHHVCKLRQMIK